MYEVFMTLRAVYFTLLRFSFFIGKNGVNAYVSQDTLSCDAVTNSTKM